MNRTTERASSGNTIPPRRLLHFCCLCLFTLLFGCGGGGGTNAAGGTLSSAPNVTYLDAGDGTQDLLVTAEIHAAPGRTYRYRNVNIHSGGKLIFDDVAAQAEGRSWAGALRSGIRAIFGAAADTATAETHFWAKSILVENEGTLRAGSEDAPFASLLVIHLYGSNADQEGITCQTTDTAKWTRYCGVEAKSWADHTINYESLPDERLANAQQAFFGRKALAVSYGGTLQLFGRKGMTKGSIAVPQGGDVNAVSGTSWARLGATAEAKTDKITLDRVVDWEKGDLIVITTTDFLPGHSEQRQIAAISAGGGRSVITLSTPLSYRHNGEAYDLTKHDLAKQKIARKTVETRAAVALLSRNIRIVSAGKRIGDPELPAADSPDTDRYFGGHAVIRQGFSRVQIQGVEFHQMGQGGMLARSPLQFLAAYDAPADTFVRDCSFHDSMTRWIELRGAQNLLLERNVGYKSIGHGYMSAGYEAQNTYRANIGIYARPALKYPDNPRNVPGVYAQTLSEDPWTDPGPPAWCNGTDTKDMSTQSDYVTPAVFLIANPYNTYEYNMAAGAGACGSCFWLVPAPAVGPPETAPAGYASAMRRDSHAPLYSFKGNYCSTAQYSLLTIGGITSCNGVTTNSSYTSCRNPGTKEQETLPILVPLKNDADHALMVNTGSNYLPKLAAGNCRKGDTAGCAVSVIDSYTSSFHWGQQNWSAIWLRNNWFLFTDGALTDILGPGLTMVSGGSYEQVMNGYWALTRRSVFVGQTQQGNDFATAAGPKVTSATGLSCEGKNGAYCLFSKEGISIPTDNFLNYQRFYNIYDGPVYQEANAYLNIRPTPLGKVTDGEYIYGMKTNDANRGLGIPKAKERAQDGRYGVNDCILTNAAVAWKQPNGFYYPAAFHSRNLFFDGVDLRHFVLVPLFAEGTRKTDAGQVAAQYCTSAGNIFDSFTDVDRQTELNDDDGSLSGIKGVSDYGSVSLNRDTFYHLPKMTYQCASEQSCFQVAYDHVTANIFPKCLAKDGDTGPGTTTGCRWQPSCGDPSCLGVPLYRQYLNTGEPAPGDNRQMMRMLGQGVGQRVNLVANNGKYFIDTAQPAGNQNDFEPRRTYYVYLLYAKADTKVTFQVYVGRNADKAGVLNAVQMVRLGTKSPDGFVLVPPFEFTVQSPWQWEQPDYAPESGILTVKMDMAQFEADFREAGKEACKPSSVCQWNGTSCGCAAQVKGINYACEDAVCEWSTRAMECPANGCIGFQFTLPTEFAADGGNHRPIAEPFPASWSISWKDYLVDRATAGSCTYGSDPPDPR